MAMKKKSVLAVSVTTWEALSDCVAENVSVFVIENPLYSECFQNTEPEKYLREYDIEIFREKQVILCRKNRGEGAFDRERNVPRYLPLEWKNWHS